MSLNAFYLKYSDIRIRIAPFRMKTDFETVKTVAVIDELINRADAVQAGADPGGRFGITAGHTVENYLSRAERYTSALEKGLFPLAGMFAEPGMTVVDHTFIEKDGKMHLFYNRGYIGFEWDTRFVDTFGHAVTEDLIHWQIEPICFTAQRGGHDDYQIWSPGIVKKDKLFYMYYTGVNIHIAQAICMATSEDLYHWKRYGGNPVLLPGAWGEWHADRWSDCRDSMVFSDTDGTAYMYYCTEKKNENGQLQPALGIASSRDMFSWKDEGAYFFEACEIALESPYVMEHNGLYYLFYTNCGRGTAYAVSESPITGWRDCGMLIEKQGVPELPANVPSCSEVFAYRGKWYISCVERQPGCEQYLEIFEFFWNADGTVSVGKRLE